MKKFILITMLMSVSFQMMAQDDDVYFVPKKDATAKTVKETYYSGIDRDVDEYNRRGQYNSSSIEVNDSDIISFDGEEGVYPDSLGSKAQSPKYSRRHHDYGYDYDDDYYYSRELSRWYGFYNPWFYSRGYWGPYYYGYGWYSPYYSSFYGFYDPWYYPYYSGWYGYYDPWYYGYYGGWYRPWYYSGYYGGYYRNNYGGVGAGYSNRGRALSSTGGGSGAVNNNRYTRGNVYNDIAKRNESRSRVVSSRRSVGSRSVGTDRNVTVPRNYNPTYSNQRTNPSGYSGGSRSFGGGSFGGGRSMGGGSRGGGFSGGGHGGRR
jgi:hypothetical protein